MSKAFPQKLDKNSIRCQFFLGLLFFGCFSAMGVQKHDKKRFVKQIVSRGTKTKNERSHTSAEPIQKAPTHLFFADLFLGGIFRRFSAWGVQKHQKQSFRKSQKKTPTHLRGPFFLGVP
jgi:hypothetical protein